MEQKRFSVIDNIKGVLIFLVVFAHFLLVIAKKGNGLCFDLYSFIYLFHMPLFMFLSGLLTHDVKKDWLVKSLSVFFIFDMIYLCVGIMKGLNLDILEPVYSMWYILVLILFRLITGFFNYNKPAIFGLSVICFFLLQMVDFDNFIFIKFGAFFIYFAAGFCLKNFIPDMVCNYKDIKTKFGWFLILTGCFAIEAFLVYKFNIGFSFLNHFGKLSISSVIFSLFLFIINLGIIFSLLNCVRNKEIAVLSSLGKNSLWIYLFHRLITLIVPVYFEEWIWIVISVMATIIVCLIFGNNIFREFMNRIFEQQKILSGVAIIFCIFGVCFYGYNNKEIQPDDTVIYPEIKASELDNCIKISYIGDMLLFEKDNQNDDYDRIFDEVKSDFGDYTFGVFEGIVSADGKKSVGNYYDRSRINLRYSDDFAKKVAENIDFVTLGMNHLMDGTIEDIDYTTKLFDEIGLLYCGVGNRVKYIDIEGTKIAVLGYTDIMNYEGGDDIYFGFDEKSILQDINDARNSGAKYIFAMTHMGEEFNHGTVDRQDYWYEFLARHGVDVILGDHSHVTEPVEYIGKTVVINCPGNFVSSLTTSDQDYGAICNLYMNRDGIECIGIIPIHSVIENDGQVCVEECFRHNDIAGSNIVLKSMLGKAIDYVMPEYFYNENGYLMMNYDMNTVYGAFGDNSVCFIGDSITEGTMNNGHGWYECLETGDVYNISKGGATTKTILELLNKNVPEADIYVLAIGCNDIRYGEIEQSEYIENVDRIVGMLPEDSEIIIISPWYTTENDVVSVVDYDDRNQMVYEWNENLESYCEENGCQFVDMYDSLKEYFEKNPQSEYLIDGIHPNGFKGVELYSKLFSEKITNSRN